MSWQKTKNKMKDCSKKSPSKKSKKSKKSPSKKTIIDKNYITDEELLAITDEQILEAINRKYGNDKVYPEIYENRPSSPYITEEELLYEETVTKTNKIRPKNYYNERGGLNDVDQHEFIIGNFDENNKKMACFDYDWTIVKPKSGNIFPIDKDDYEWFRKSVPDVLKKYSKLGYAIYVITNQSKSWKLEMIKNSLSPLNIPIKVIVGARDVKKPNPNLFKYKFDKKDSFYTGDAAGRENDWSVIDKEFAERIGIVFKIPEEVFPFDVEKKKNINKYTKQEQEVIILVGYMASGKSTFAKEKFGEYEIISGDTYTVPNMIKEGRKCLKEKKSIVFDATNGTKVKRALFISLAKEFKVSVRCFVFQMDMKEAMEWNSKRFHETGKNVPPVAFYTYRKRYEEPSEDEGCKIVYI
jgi:DNA 3'-phosphatase